MTRIQRIVATALTAMTLSTLVAIAPANAALGTNDAPISQYGKRIIWVA